MFALPMPGPDQGSGIMLISTTVTVSQIMFTFKCLLN